MPGWSAGSIVSARLASTLKSITIGTISATFVRSLARSSGLRRAFVEPVGFHTSYEDRVGRDPGASRLRVKPVDEARLLTRPRPEDFEQSDLSGVTSFFAPAITREAKLAGQMLILNRGPQGAGYLWCPICEHARPAPTDAIGGAEIRAIQIGRAHV